MASAADISAAEPLVFKSKYFYKPNEPVEGWGCHTTSSARYKWLRQYVCSHLQLDTNNVQMKELSTDKVYRHMRKVYDENDSHLSSKFKKTLETIFAKKRPAIKVHYLKLDLRLVRCDVHRVFWHKLCEENCHMNPYAYDYNGGLKFDERVFQIFGKKTHDDLNISNGVLRCQRIGDIIHTWAFPDSFGKMPDYKRAFTALYQEWIDAIIESYNVVHNKFMANRSKYEESLEKTEDKWCEDDYYYIHPIWEYFSPDQTDYPRTLKESECSN